MTNNCYCIMGESADDRYDDNDFLNFHWDVNGDLDRDDGNESNDSDNVIIRSRADLVHEISRLATCEAVGDVGDDLHSVVLRVGSPFPCQFICDNETDGYTGSRSKCIICNLADLRQRNSTIQHYMGSMAQCRGAGGDTLREAGAIEALLNILWRLIVPQQIVGQDHDQNEQGNGFSLLLLPTIESEVPTGETDLKFDLESICNNHLHLQNNSPNFRDIAMNEMDVNALDLAMSCLGSLRDLSCGSALNRAAVLAWTPPSPTQCIENGVHVLSAYVKRYDRLHWEQLLSLQERGSEVNINEADATTFTTDRGKKELRLLTNALGTIRNTSHSTPDVCQEFFNNGIVDCLIWRLMPDDDALEKSNNVQSTTPKPSSLPEASCPWRESCFRAAGSLINLAEKCPDVAYQLGSNRRLIYLLIEAWGGASAITVDPNQTNVSTRGLPLLHLGLAAILNAAGNGALEGGLDGVMVQVLEKEKIRKRAAQRREEERKLQKAKQNA